MSDSSTSSGFLDRLNRGDDEALNELVVRYYDQLIALASRKMGDHIRSEPVDVAQSAMGSAIRGIREGRFKVPDTHRLWNLLMTITLTKIRKRSGRLTDLRTLVRQEPRVESHTFMDKVVDRVLADSASIDRRILGQALAGYDQSRISENLKVSESEISDHLIRLISRFEQQFRMEGPVEYTHARNFLTALAAGTDAKLKKAFWRYVDRVCAERSVGADSSSSSEPEDRWDPLSVPPLSIGEKDCRRDVSESRQLWALLVTTALNAIRMKGPKSRHQEMTEPESVLAQGALPEDLVILDDLVEWAMEKLEDVDRQIVTLCLMDTKRADIARRFGIQEDTVQRRYNRFWRRLEPLLMDGDEEDQQEDEEDQQEDGEDQQEDEEDGGEAEKAEGESA